MSRKARRGVEAVAACLDGGRTRLLIKDAVAGIAIASPLMAIALALTRPTLALALGVAAAGLGIAAAVVVFRAPGRTRARAASLIEGADPSFKNLIVTAEELARHPDRSAGWIGQRVFDEAARRLADVDLGAAMPLARSLAVAAASLLVSVALVAGARATRDGTVPGGTPLASATANSRQRIEVRLEPPAYSKRPPAVLVDPERVDALEGTTLTLSVNGGATPRVRYGDRELAVSAGPAGAAATTVLQNSGYLAIEPPAGASAGEHVALIAVTVTPDRVPLVKVEQPGRDLLLPSAKATVDVDAAASDDIGLSRVALKYTRVSGSGEQFEFIEGELPLDVAKGTAQSWRARGRIPIAKLGLEPGDSLVYRVTAQDGRPGAAGAGSSDTFFVEIAGPGQVALEGFEMPPEQERYALSQQMIVVKLRRLRDREKGLERPVFEEQTNAIAAEQRAVRGNFVFLMGGHVEDEEEEAEHSNEILEGRLENTARREIWRAVTHMSAVEQSLAAYETAPALAAAIRAVEALQRAFTRNRYILRTLPARLRIDPSRRLSGELDEVKNDDRPTPRATDDPDVVLARDLLTEVIALVPRLRNEPDSAGLAGALSAAAEQALAAAARDEQWGSVSQSMLRLRQSAAGRAGQPQIVNAAAAVIRALQQRVRADAAVVRAGGGGDRLEGAWAAEARRK